ncbi:EamA family transporter, partial [Ascidiaceihabitans sp.]|nr:EamA family transporter [Ascidiaceihabitans sp.]
MTKTQATALGFGAVLMWALLAVLTVKAMSIPPFQLTAMSFAVGGALGLVWVFLAGEAQSLKTVSWNIYAFGTVGLFGYHFFYFSALRLAPAAEAGLIAYLWPLLIVFFSGLLPGEQLKAGHIIGGLIGFAGAALIVTQGGTSFEASAALGYGLALLCAVTWSSYSVISRRLGQVPTSSVAVFCLATAALSGVAHLGFEDTVWPIELTVWLAVIGLGVGPVGLAFFVWDVGVKRGDIQLLGVASYAAPLLSTFVLVIVGIADMTWALLG